MREVSCQLPPNRISGHPLRFERFLTALNSPFTDVRSHLPSFATRFAISHDHLRSAAAMVDFGLVVPATTGTPVEHLPRAYQLGSTAWMYGLYDDFRTTHLNGIHTHIRFFRLTVPPR